ncbi:MAG: pyruvate kinase [Actinobacteria bacterium]|uniref:pyruvate kinase n=1 Tax=freshwater metagenome TaxID=449393 RepID=A0A6J6XPU5_9ZZZZ|nr:pyruvate kinase [Actinomycetota bacterium]MSX83235.1 pyruvate kinase [Actinomycetota bacterium]
MRRAKIVCTIGPATASPEKILELVEAGMDVARLNMSHGDQATHAAVIERIRDAAAKTGRSVGILVDLQGPKIRLGTFADGSVLLREGDTFVITTDDVVGTRDIASTTYSGLAGDVHAGDLILIDDGRVCLRAISVEGSLVRTMVLEGGRISDHKGINLPGVPVSVPAMSEKDHDDLRWALKAGIDWVALSFVRNADDFDVVQAVMTEVGISVPVIAKIEKPQAVDALEEIVDRFDAIMVARGDLGVELPLEMVPLVQKRAIVLAREAAKPVIVATQMLESMVSMSRPTRAEASDVANAVLDGTDALMLSGETSIGAHPIASVETMARIISAVESEALAQMDTVNTEPRNKGEAIASAATSVGAAINAEALVAFTQTGTSAHLVARYRSPIPIYAFTPVEEVRNRLTLVWGVETFLVPPVVHTDQMVRQVDAALLDMGRVERETSVVIVAGSPPGIPGSTNAMRVHVMGHAVSEQALAYRE